MSAQTTTPIRKVIATIGLFSFTSALFVYFIPVSSGQSIYGAFDAFGYAELVSNDKSAAVAFQRFLFLYPQWLAAPLQFFYAVALHLVVMSPVFFLMRGEAYLKPLAICLTAALIPESTIFLGAPSKEGLGICAILVVIAFHIQFNGTLDFRSFALAVYAIVLAELSRPGFSVVFFTAILISILPHLRSISRANLVLLLLLFFSAIIVLLFGPFYEKFYQVYADTKSFLLFFESDMASNSEAKSGIRGLFLLAFLSDKPDAAFIVLIILFAILKAFIYFFAIPLISLPERMSMPYFTWALGWQVATSISSIYCTAGVLSAITKKQFSSPRAQSLLLLACSLLFLIAISTAIFHVRYRAPAVVAFVAAIAIARYDSGEVKGVPWLPMQMLFLLAAAFAIVDMR